MKKLELMSKEAMMRHDYCCCGDDFVRGFEAGFRQARDMIVEKVTLEIGKAGLPTVGVDPSLGEEEV